MATPTIAHYAPTAPATLFGRANCPANTFQCPASLGAVFSDICCQNGQTCALDTQNNAACCPSGAVCTGVAPSTAPTAGPDPGASYVPNSYFSFPYAQTSFSDSSLCSSAVSACSQNYDACVTDLHGGSGLGVTIAVPGGGGVTVDGTGASLGASATSLCSSLSSKACSGLQATGCNHFGSHSSRGARDTPRKGITTAVICLAIFMVMGVVP